MVETILFVDDDLRILNALQQTLSRQYQIQIAGGVREGLDLVRDGRFAVVVSDLNMPGMDGIGFLSQVKSIAPRTVGILLTGWADLETAIDALNAGHIFRFLRKPCPQNQLRNTLDVALAQYRLNCVERDFFGDTLIETLGMLMEVLSEARPEAFGRTARIHRLVQHIASELNLLHVWEFEAAGVLSQIGCIAVTREALKRYFAGAELTPEEKRQLLTHPNIGSRLVRRISRLGPVAKMIEHQADAFSEMSDVHPEDLKIRIGAQMLKVATEFDRLLRMGVGPSEASARMRRHAGEYNPQILDAIDRLIGSDGSGLGLRQDRLVVSSPNEPVSIAN